MLNSFWNQNEPDALALSETEYTVEYRPGKHNLNADPLSRDSEQLDKDTDTTIQELFPTFTKTTKELEIKELQNQREGKKRKEISENFPSALPEMIRWYNKEIKKEEREERKRMRRCRRSIRI